MHHVHNCFGCEVVVDMKVSLFGGEVVVDMKSDDRHRNKTTKDRFYEITRKHTLVVEGTKFTPLAEPQDCYYLSRLPNMLKCQIQAMDELSLDNSLTLVIW